ncbi:3-coathanger stack domain-containing protein [Lacihabitans lacunae]|uniref:3-coathanger stack domain-containing protein n=1 Tax=Lacihabitans lacunae TaxID=1028214 RepID=A0ABV7Z0I4_9BACT
MKRVYKYLLIVFGLISFSTFGQSVSLTKIPTPAFTGYQNSSPNVYALKFTAVSGTSNLKKIIFSTSSEAGSYTSADVSSFSLGVAASPTANINYNLAPAVTSTGNGEFLEFNVDPSFYTYFTVSPGEERYLYLRASIKPTATVGHTIRINGMSNPAVAEFLPLGTTFTNPNIDNAGIATIASKSIKLETTIIPTSNMFPSVSSHIYTMKVTSTGGDHKIKSFNFPFTGTLPASELSTSVQLLQNTVNDISTATNAIPIYCSASTTISIGGGSINNILINNGACSIYWPTVGDGETKYFFLKVTPKSTALTASTYITNANSNPPSIITEEPAVIPINLQSGTGTQTIVQPSLTLSTETLAATNVYKNESPILYKLKIDPSTSNAVLNSLSFKTRGTYLPADISNFRIAYGTVSDITSLLGPGATRTAASGPNIENVSFTGINLTIMAGTPTYIYVLGKISSTATVGRLIKINGSTDPITTTFTTAGAAIDNFQTDGAGSRSIITSNITLTPLAVPATNIVKGSTKNVIYKAKISNLNPAVNLNSISFLTSGTYATGDFTNFRLSITNSDDVNLIPTYYYHNLNTTPTSNGESVTFTSTLGSTFANSISITGDKYLWITADASPSATNNNTIKINASSNPLTLTFFENPNISLIPEMPSDIAGTQTIKDVPLILSSLPTPAANVYQGEYGNPLYILKVESPSLPATISSITIQNTGTITGSPWYGPDMSGFFLFYNTINDFNTATFLAGSWRNQNPYLATNSLFFYSFDSSPIIAAGQSGYFFLIARAKGTGVVGHNFKIDGSSNPTTIELPNGGIPSITNNQTDVGGLQTIIARTVTPTPVVTTSSATYCSGNSPAGVTLTGTNCPSPSQTAWFEGGSSVAFASSNGSIVVTPTATTTYTTMCAGTGYTSAVSNSVTISPVIINQPTSLIASPTTSPSPGSPITLTANGCAGQSVIWDDLSSVNPRIVSPSSSSSYTFRCFNSPCTSSGQGSYTINIGPCPMTLTLASTADDIGSGTLLKTASANAGGNISATNKINGTADVKYTARAINLLPGFLAETNKVFLATPGGCN